MTGFALSPDGRNLAIAVQPDNDKREPDLTEVKVITLATGVTRTWTANGTIGFGPDDARSLSWAANGGRWPSTGRAAVPAYVPACGSSIFPLAAAACWPTAERP